MTYAVDIDQEVKYVLEDDRGLEDGDKAKPVFVLKALTATQVADVDDAVLRARPGSKKKKGKKKKNDSDDGDVIAMHVGTTVIKVLDAGLVRFENMHLSNGTSIDWDEEDRAAMYSCIPSVARQELANEIRNRSDLSEDTVKNLDTGLDL